MEKIYIIDASGYIYRSYFAIRSMTNAKGESTNALFGFIRSVLKLIKDFSPNYLVAVFDGPNNGKERKQIYADYKAHRTSMPGDLLYQILWAQEFCQLIGIPELMIPDVEADDTIGAVSIWAAATGAQAFMCTSDKDMCQLINDKIFILNTFKDNLILDSQGVIDQYGVRPDQMIDYLAITGDASDNIPGIPGFGPKTASDLLKQFGTLEYILKNPLAVTGQKKQTALIENKDLAILSRRLVKINTAVQIPYDPQFYKLEGSPNPQKLREFYAQMGFNSLIREMEAEHPTTQPQIEKVVEDVHYQLVDDELSLDNLITYLSKQKEICVDTETTGLSYINARLVGLAFGVEPKKVWYVPTNGKLGLTHVLQKIKPLLENPSIGFYGHNIKYDYHILLNHGIKIATISFDTILASYILNSHNRQHSLDTLSLEIFDKVKTPITDLIGKGKNQICMSEVPIEKVCQYCCEDVDYTIRLKQVLASQIEERGLVHILKDIELPLLPVLVNMERQGIYVDIEFLHDLSKTIHMNLSRLEEEIYQMAGEKFNLNSPKQLSDILFVKLGIKPLKKTATGHSTNVDVLEALSADYPIAHKLIEYRILEKLRSTYIESLPLQVNSVTNRIHCSFNQYVAATGRLSCQDPNLQNIPVRTEIGRSIREAFRPQKPGWSFLSADYSQIELRILAHLSEDPVLTNAFLAKEDIHTLTASLIFNVPITEVSSEQRHQAKAVNFGIIYGQQAFGLAQELHIDTKTAAEFIHKYFERYGKIKSFIQTAKEQVRHTGKATTILGRERLIPEIHNKNAMIRNQAERLAINTPIQGSQADIIKLAMIEIDKKLKRERKKGFMVLQIHDELIFEVPDDEIEEVSQLVKQTMEEIKPLKIPLIVDIHIGKNWKEC